MPIIFIIWITLLFLAIWMWKTIHSNSVYNVPASAFGKWRQGYDEHIWTLFKPEGRSIAEVKFYTHNLTWGSHPDKGYSAYFDTREHAMEYVERWLTKHTTLDNIPEPQTKRVEDMTPDELSLHLDGILKKP